MENDSSRVVEGSNELKGVSTRRLIQEVVLGLPMLQEASLRKLAVPVPNVEGPRMTWRDGNI